MMVTVSFPDQSALRKSLDNYIKSYGVTAKFVAKQLQIHETTISHFRAGRVNLSNHNYVKLFNFIMLNQ